MKEYPNPDRFIFQENKDTKGKRFLNGYPNIRTNCNVAFKDKNMVFKGKPKIFVRNGESEFGEEIGFSFLIEGVITDYKVNSIHDCVEFYLPKDKGIQFLKEFIKFLEEKK